MAELLPQATNISIDKIQITQVSINAYPVNARGITVTYLLGYNNNDELITIGNYRNIAITCDDFDAIANSRPDESISFYENIKRILYLNLTK